MAETRQLIQHQHESNRNIQFTLLYTVLAFAGLSIWNQSVLATYVYLLTNENPESVGFITAVMGMSQLLASIPTGYIADVYRRDSVLKVASAVGLLAITVTLLELFAVEGSSYKLLVVSLAFWGIFRGIANPALDALFADSIPDGGRSYYFAQKSIGINAGTIVGPTMALLMFYFLGNTWTLKDCAAVMSLGQAVCLPAVLLLSFFNDDDAHNDRRRTGTSHEAIMTSNNNSLTEPFLSATYDDPEPDLAPRSPETIELTGCLVGEQLDSTAQSTPDYVYFFLPRHRIAPVLICISDLTSGIASGMSVRYFPIFFVKILHLSPVQVQIIYLVAPLTQGFLVRSGQYFSERFGRCQVTVAHKWIGITLMFLLVILSHLRFPSWLICVVYVLRTGFMNSTTALTKSILMDNVPKGERARWSALESVNTFSWSGSAALGGLLVSLHGLLFNFCVTATMQFLATLPILALMWAMDVDEDDDKSQGQQRSIATSPPSDSDEEATVTEPSADDDSASGSN